MKKRNLIILVSLLAVFAGAASYSVYKKNQKSTLEIEDTAFSIPDTTDVDKIFFASKLGWKATLEKKNGVWYINNYKASKGMVKMLLRTMHLQRIKRPVIGGERETAIKNIATKGVKVEVYKKGKLDKTFFVGGNTNDALGTYFIMKGSENPFVVYLPGLNGFIDIRYKITEEDYRDTQLFGSNPESLERLSVEYPKNPALGFYIEKEGDQLKLFGPESPYNDQVLSNYLLKYKNTHILNYFDDYDPEVVNFFDSLNRLVPDAIISIRDSKPAFSNSIRIYNNMNNPDGGWGVAMIAGDRKYVSYQDYIFQHLLVPVDFFKKE